MRRTVNATFDTPAAAWSFYWHTLRRYPAQRYDTELEVRSAGDGWTVAGSCFLDA